MYRLTPAFAAIAPSEALFCSAVMNTEQGTKQVALTSRQVMEAGRTIQALAEASEHAAPVRPVPAERAVAILALEGFSRWLLLIAVWAGAILGITVPFFALVLCGWLAAHRRAAAVHGRPHRGAPRAARRRGLHRPVRQP